MKGFIMKRLSAFLILFIFMIVILPVSAQDISIVRPTESAAPVPEAGSGEVVQHPTGVTAPVIDYSQLANVTGTGVMNGRGTNTVTLWDRSLYINQPKSVNLPNAKEYYQSGIEVPKPDLDRPITDPWDDLKQGYACEAILNRPYYFQKMAPGEEFELDITFRNVGTATWDFNIDVMKYTGDPLEKNPEKTAYDLWKTADPESTNINSHIVRPWESVRVKIPMRAPTEKYHDDNKYYAAYTLVRNWGDYGPTDEVSWDVLHDGRWDLIRDTFELPNAMFCPVYFYIYVPD